MGSVVQFSAMLIRVNTGSRQFFCSIYTHSKGHILFFSLCLYICFCFCPFIASCRLWDKKLSWQPLVRWLDVFLKTFFQHLRTALDPENCTLALFFPPCSQTARVHRFFFACCVLLSSPFSAVWRASPQWNKEDRWGILSITFSWDFGGSLHFALWQALLTFLRCCAFVSSGYLLKPIRMLFLLFTFVDEMPVSCLTFLFLALPCFLSRASVSQA